MRVAKTTQTIVLIRISSQMHDVRNTEVSEKCLSSESWGYIMSTDDRVTRGFLMLEGYKIMQCLDGSATTTNVYL